MTELKTLKDLQDKTNPCMKCGSIQCAICYDDLKQEAIKWIKSFQKGECHTDFAADGRNGQENISEWIEHFFNLEERDLK
jgi:hypothetical protein